MYTKFKSAVASFWHRIIARMYEMSIEQEAAVALKVAVADVEEVVAKVENLIEPAAKVVEAAVAPVVATAAADASSAVSATPALAVSVSCIIAKIKSVLAVVDGVPLAFDTLADLAIKAAGSDIEAALGMFEKMLDLAGVKSAFWDEVVAAAKAI